MNYLEALNWVQSKLKFGIKPGLERMAWMLNELGNPQHNLAAVHVVGTNGKGSTVSYLQHIFSSAGYDVGTFTSPYIVDFRERISLNGQMISKKDFVDVVQKIKPVVDRLPLETTLEAATEFEVITLLMFEYFGHVHPVDIAFIEAGLGGQYDSTNVFKALAVICPSIGLDHQAVLGSTHREIAEQKVGVLKDLVPFIFAADRDDVKTVFYQKAKRTGSPVYQVGKDFYSIWQGDYFSYRGLSVELSHIRLKLPGRHQALNASLAITAAVLLQRCYPKITLTVIKTALMQTVWAGRTEFILPNLLLDGAHNLESMAALIDVVKDFSDQKIHILFAAINDKPVAEMLNLLDQAGTVEVTQFDYPKALALSDYPTKYSRVADWRLWLQMIKKQSKDDFYLVTGSLYFISQVRRQLLSTASI
ncbi:bifunctional folylpolyglutamate synthase/dihydrofolate synthase [Streptococcus pantholopis]|uniref:tetrahydrofolate synthase n=1 Tax=Streptococcus pantholopis TaxID=1811193 RepID=A0A172Q6W7_9STRE|nr:folylpolyglutamate synthase/dihydrofolate synthase family protein [Streptococcus pantholopis]AND79243.1 dihydrofolate synthase [Streptococcus pantholopis]